MSDSSSISLTSTRPPIQRADLYFRQGSSDKEYHATLEAVSGRFVVNFAYGKRGSALQTGTKTATPVTREKAQQVFDKLVAEKAAKGYQPGDGTADYVPAAKAVDPTVGQVQLLNAIDEDEVSRYIEDAAFIAQEKMDGERRGIGRRQHQMVATNRRALPVGFPRRIESALAALAGEYQLDGEQVGEVYWAFDCTVHEGMDVSGLGVLERTARLTALLSDVASPTGPVRIVPTAHTRDEKAALVERVRAAGGEGVVFKRKDAPYCPGRPASGGDWIKFKFTGTATVRVARVNAGKRSVVMTLTDDLGAAIEVGSVTIPPNAAIPKAGDLIEVEYLYAYRGGSLFQPVYKTSRSDLTEEDCLDQLKYKAEAAA